MKRQTLNVKDKIKFPRQTGSALHRKRYRHQTPKLKSFIQSAAKRSHSCQPPATALPFTPGWCQPATAIY
jgi:hypothetical protein